MNIHVPRVALEKAVFRPVLARVPFAGVLPEKRMRAKRKKISKTTRFEIFKRDKFTCQYCGKQAPNTVLVIDHIHPVSKGGEEILLNYTTSCDTCNSGKGARILADDSIVLKQRAEVQLLAEQREQVEMMLAWHKSLATAKDFEIDSFVAHWASMVQPFKPNQLGIDDAKKWLRKFSLHDLLTSSEIAVSQYMRRDDRYLPTSESVNLAWSKIPGIARISKLPSAERDLYYVRGILRNRLDYVNEAEAMELLTDALDCGVDTDALKSHARQVETWKNWRADIKKFIDDEAKRARS